MCPIRSLKLQLEMYTTSEMYTITTHRYLDIPITSTTEFFHRFSTVFGIRKTNITIIAIRHDNYQQRGLGHRKKNVHINLQYLLK